MAHAAAAACRLPLWQYLTRFTGRRPALPRPMMNILNGGRHAPNNIDIQEFMVIPLGCPTFADGLERCVRVTHRLGALLEEAGLACGVGDEGGFAPRLKNEEQALELILRAIEDCRLRPGEDMALALDAAAGEWQTGNNMYLLPKENRLRTPHDLLEYWRRLTTKYPIISLEDPAGRMTGICGGSSPKPSAKMFSSSGMTFLSPKRPGWSRALPAAPPMPSSSSPTRWAP